MPHRNDMIVAQGRGGLAGLLSRCPSGAPIGHRGAGLFLPPLPEVPASKGPPAPEPSELSRGFGVRQCSAALGVGAVLRKRQSTAAKTLARIHRLVLVQGCKVRQNVRALLPHFRSSLSATL